MAENPRAGDNDVSPSTRICPRCLSDRLDPWTGPTSVDAAKTHNAAQARAAAATDRGVLFLILAVVGIIIVASAFVVKGALALR